MRKEIISDPEILSGTPVFAGTRIPLDQVIGLIRKGTPDSELAEDFPSLNQEDLDYAREQERLHEALPRPSRRLKLRRSTKAA